MKIEESFVIQAPIGDVWRFITDPLAVGPCVPGCDAVEVLSETSYRGRVSVAVGPISAKFNVVVDVTEQNPPNRIASVTRGEEGGRASLISSKNELRLTEIDQSSTRVDCSAEVSVSGRLGKFGFPIMKKKASQLAVQFAAAMQDRLRTTTTPADMGVA